MEEMLKLNLDIRSLNGMLVPVDYLSNASLNVFAILCIAEHYYTSVAGVALIGLPSSTYIYVWRSSYSFYQ